MELELLSHNTFTSSDKDSETADMTKRSHGFLMPLKGHSYSLMRHL